MRKTNDSSWTTLSFHTRGRIVTPNKYIYQTRGGDTILAQMLSIFR